MKTIILIIAILAPVTGYGQTTVTLNWTDTNNSEEGTNIYRDGVKIGQVGPNVTSYKDTVTGGPGTKYVYEVSAFNHQYSDGTGNVQESARSNQATFTVPAAVVPAPIPPSGLTTAASPTSIRLSWADNSQDETGFEGSRREFKPKDIVSYFLVSANETTYVDSGLTRNRTYCYQIRAKGTQADSNWSNESCATTPPQ